MLAKHSQSHAIAERIALWAVHTVHASISDILTLLFAWAVQSRTQITPSQLRHIATRVHTLQGARTTVGA